MRRAVIFVLFVWAWQFIHPVNAQSQTQNVKSNKAINAEYVRNSLTVLYLDAAEKYAGLIKSGLDTLIIPDKYFDNTLAIRSIPLGVDRKQAEVKNNYNLLISRDFVESALKNAKVGNQLVSKWFERKEDGTFGVGLLKERGVYNATDNDVLVAGTSKRGTAGLMDMGMGLVDKSYVIVLDFPEIVSMEEQYAKDSIPEKDRKMNGFTGKMNAYVYKLNFTEETAANFFQNLWVSGNSKDLATRKALFDKNDFQLTYINTFSENLAISQFNPGQKFAPKVQKTPEQMMRSMMDMGYQQSLIKLENSRDEFRVKAMIFETHPIAIKIGRKEGLKFDQRYFVYENRQDRHGNTYSKRKAVIRSMSVADNKKVATGETKPSYFYQVAGGKIDNYGMFAEQKNATGINLFLGYNQEGLSAATGRLEVYISPLLYEMFSRGKTARGLTGLKLYIEGGYGWQTFSDKYDFYKGVFGLSKEIYLMPGIHIDPFLGYGVEEASTNANEDKISSEFVELGSRLGLNIAHNVQLIGGVNYSIITKCETKAEGSTEPVKTTYSDMFDGRGGLGTSFGIRFMF